MRCQISLVPRSFWSTDPVGSVQMVLSLTAYLLAHWAHLHSGGGITRLGWKRTFSSWNECFHWWHYYRWQGFNVSNLWQKTTGWIFRLFGARSKSTQELVATSEIATRHAKQDDVPLILCSFRKAEFDQSMGAFMFADNRSKVKCNFIQWHNCCGCYLLKFHNR